MPYVEVDGRYLNPMLITSIESTSIKRTTIDEEGDEQAPIKAGLSSAHSKTAEEIPCVQILCQGGYKVIVEGTDDAEAVAKHISGAFDECLKLCGTSQIVPTQKAVVGNNKLEL